MQLSSFKKFMASQDGAVTVDWVVLTAAVCALAGAAIFNIYSGTEDAGDVVGDWLTARRAGSNPAP